MPMLSAPPSTALATVKQNEQPHTYGDDVRAFGARLRAKRAVVGVVGQGYVGFPLAQRIAKCGYKTVGFDLNGDTVVRCQEENRSRNYHAAMTVFALQPCDVLIVAVPTPTRFNGVAYEPDLSMVVSAVRSLVKHVLSDGRQRLVILESTYAPGTTRNVVVPLIEEAHTVGETVFVGYSPERIDPGNSRFTLENTPKVTSGYDEASAYLTQLFYSQILERAVAASSMEAAEATKILENTFRFINITFAQEFDTYCEALGVDAHEVTSLASSKPFGFMPFFAGPGIGGHCIAEDPYFLYESMVEEGIQPKILEAAIQNHEGRARVIVDRIARHLGRPLKGARILLLGVSYKPNIGDARRSPAMPILQLLEAAGASVEYHDEYVARFANRTSVDLPGADPANYHLAVLLTVHTTVDYTAMEAAGWRIYNARGTATPEAARAAPRRSRQLGEMLGLTKSPRLAEAG
jgi:UDP-N-acetyl-D-glucosamine dehydrogenase